MASTPIETVSTGADKARLAAAALLVVGALAAFYLLRSQGALAQWGSTTRVLVVAERSMVSVILRRRLPLRALAAGIVG